MDAREFIVELDGIRVKRGMTQAEWSRQAGYDEFGKLVSRAFNRGNCKLSTAMRLARPLGYEVGLIPRGYRIHKTENGYELEREETDGKGNEP